MRTPFCPLRDGLAFWAPFCLYFLSKGLQVFLDLFAGLLGVPGFYAICAEFKPAGACRLLFSADSFLEVDGVGAAGFGAALAVGVLRDVSNALVLVVLLDILLRKVALDEMVIDFFLAGGAFDRDIRFVHQAGLEVLSPAAIAKRVLRVAGELNQVTQVHVLEADLALEEELLRLLSVLGRTAGPRTGDF